MVFKVYLSPSTQEHNPCKAGDTEEQHMNRICDILEAMLKQRGFIVYRNKPGMTLAEVIKDSNRKKPNIHLALHSNAGGGKGTEVWCWKTPGKLTNSERLARCIYDVLAPLTPFPDRGVKDGHLHPKLGEVAKVKATSVIIEVVFHDRPDEAAWLHKNMELIAAGIDLGVVYYLHIPYDI